MAKNPTVPNPAATAFQPPRNLGDPGLSLWNALAISSVVAGDTTLALAGHPKPSRPMPLPGGVVCGGAVAAE
jgi:hypothetical protein